MYATVEKYLEELSVVQDTVLTLLKRKGELLAVSDAKSLTEIAGRETSLIKQLQEYVKQREHILEHAKRRNYPHDTIESLAVRLDREKSDHTLEERVARSIKQSRLLQHHSLTNWVLTQRTVIHLKQILDIIANKGKSTSTYSRGNQAEKKSPSGSLVDLGG